MAPIKGPALWNKEQRWGLWDRAGVWAHLSSLAPAASGTQVHGQDRTDPVSLPRSRASSMVGVQGKLLCPLKALFSE